MLRPRGPFERGYLVVSDDASNAIGLHRLEYDPPTPNRVGGELIDCPHCHETILVCRWDNGVTTVEKWADPTDDIPF
jgi:hypothetical protein